MAAVWLVVVMVRVDMEMVVEEVMVEEVTVATMVATTVAVLMAARTEVTRVVSVAAMVCWCLGGVLVS